MSDEPTLSGLAAEVAAVRARVDDLEEKHGEDHKRLREIELTMTRQLAEIGGDVKSLLKAVEKQSTLDSEQDRRLSSLEGTRFQLKGSWVVVGILGAVCLMVGGAVVTRLLDKLADTPQGPRTEHHSSADTAVGDVQNPASAHYNYPRQIAP